MILRGEYRISGFLRLSKTKTANFVSQNIARKGLVTRALRCVSPRCTRPVWYLPQACLLPCLPEPGVEGARSGVGRKPVGNVAGAPLTLVNLAACAISRRREPAVVDGSTPRSCNWRLRSRTLVAMTRQKRRKVEKRPKETHGDISDWVALRHTAQEQNIRPHRCGRHAGTMAAVTPLQFARRPGAIS
jgi:hypothetical protein